MEFNNPAFRLFNLLSELKHANHTQPTSHVLAAVFKVKAEPKELFRAIVDFHDLVSDVIDFSTHKTSLPSAPLLRYIPQIKSAVEFTNLDVAWQQYASRITTECLVVLEMVAHVEDVVQDQSPSPDTVVELKVELDRLFDFVMKNKDLDKEFRTYILQQIEQIRRCLSEYRILGPQGFVKYVELLIIQTARHSDAIKRQEHRAPEAVSMFKTILVGVKKFVALTESGVALLKQVKQIQSDGVELLEDFSSLAGSDVPEVTTTDMA